MKGILARIALLVAILLQFSCNAAHAVTWFDSHVRPDGVGDSNNSSSNGNVYMAPAEDETVIRRGLQLFMQNRGINVIEMVDNGDEAISRTIELQPDVVLMDINPHGLDGISAAREIKKAKAQSRILMLTSSDNDEDIF